MWALSFKPSVEFKDTRKISKRDWSAINESIQSLKSDPLPSGAKKIKRGKQVHYRIRQGHFRIGYKLDFEERIIRIVYIKRRSETTYR
jgi:mRNA-degrading endonuclease RelE of RelBE toxin-antitoxin system